MRTLALALLLLVPSQNASAQSPDAPGAHPRRARAMFLLASPAPSVLVASDRAWLPGTTGEAPLSVCAGDRCRPVRAIEQCEVPRCPGQGRVAILAGSVADVGGYPTDRGGFDRERDAIVQDPELAPLAGWMGYQPEPPHTPPPEWYTDDDRRTVRWELSLAVGASYLAHTDVGTGELVLGGGIRFPIDWGTSDDDDFFGVLLGSSLGVDLRAHVIPNLRGQTFDDYAVAIGVTPVFGMIPGSDIVRLPSVWGLLIPEVGGIARGDRDAALYMQWNLPVSFLLDAHAALEARATFMMIDDWVEGDAVEGIVGLSAAIVLR